MSLQPRPLKRRFGSRLLGLFVGCAVVPIAIVASLSYRQAIRHLELQSATRLDHAAESLGHALFERLLFLDATLKAIPPGAIAELAGGRERPGKPAGATPVSPPRATGARRVAGPAKGGLVSAGFDLLANRHFLALEFVGDDGRRIPVSGRLERPPEITGANRSDLAIGLPLLLTQYASDSSARTFLLRRIGRAAEPHGVLIGEISPVFLWGALDQGMPSPATRIRIIDESGHVVYASRATADTLPGEEDVDAETAGADSTGSASYLAASRTVFLDEVFAAPTWQLELSQSRDDVLGPMVNFTRIFLALVVVACLLVLLVSRFQIRRSLVPLEALQEGTRRIAQRDFASRVNLRSGDEFEHLADSFNAMADRLDRQFQALETAAEIDRAVLSATDTDAIVTTLLARMRDVYRCEIIGITLLTADGAKSLRSLVCDYADGLRHEARVELRAADVQELLDGGELREVPLGGDAPVPAYVAPLAALGARACRVLPLRYQHQLVGIIALGDRTEQPFDDERRLQARRLADQVAVALTNARMLQQVRTLAYYDSLTGLPNRLSYKERLARSLDDAARQHRLVAALFIDLDHFSRINDTLGHEAGDQLLQQVAARLRASCREREDEVRPAAEVLDPEVARLGGDEFTVLMPGLTEAHHAGQLARRILSSLAHPFRLDEREIFVNASIGIAIYPFDGEDLETLLMHADTAMYQAKEQGGGSYQAYSRSMNASALQRLTLEHSLRRALERGELDVHYQPIVEARTGRPVAAEALIRWRHPELGLLLPSEFVPLAEENGLIVPMGEWIVERACAQNRAWQEAGLPPIRVVVNLSSRQLRRDLTDTVGRILQATGLEARYLGLELTESVLVNHRKEGTDTLHALRAMGLHLSVDDFGTGYSSFSYLKHFPLDTLKIDRCFVRDITSDADDAAITTAIIAMGHALGLKVVAEGVETEPHVALLRRQGCDEMQGYFFSRPVPAGGFATWLAEHRPRRPRAAGAA